MMSPHTKNPKERVIEALLAGSAGVSILTTVGIVYILLSQALRFFGEVSLWEFLTDTQWTPLYSDKHYGILPLLTGTLLTTLIALAVAIPLGLTTAVYLNMYSSARFKRVVKPLLELLAAVPTVVYGFFALAVITPALQVIIPNLSGFNALSAGMVMGVMIIPLISSLCEDALSAIPKSLKEASYGMGATKYQTAIRVVIPAAFSGIMVSVLLALSRAVGETMIVAVAAGQQPNLTLNPLVPIETITTYIVQISSGDVAHDSNEFRTIYAAGITLFVFTFILNNIGSWITRKYQQKYE